MKIILCNGVFDILHAGHIRHLREARAMGDLLFVSLTLDENVNKGPGRPINTWSDRAMCLLELRSVSMVIPTANACAAIRSVRPAVFCKGIDYAGGDRFSEAVTLACAEVGAEIRYTTAPKMSATDMILRTREIENA